jgi:hypothetical protein
MLFPAQVAAVFYVSLDVQPKSDEKIDDDGRAKRSEGEVDEIHPNPCRSKSHFVAQIAANAEGRMFHEFFRCIHGVKIAGLDKKQRQVPDLILGTCLLFYVNSNLYYCSSTSRSAMSLRMLIRA